MEERSRAVDARRVDKGKGKKKGLWSRQTKVFLYSKGFFLTNKEQVEFTP